MTLGDDDSDGDETGAVAPTRPGAIVATWVLAIIFVILIVGGIVTVVTGGDRSSSVASSGDLQSTSATPSSVMRAPPGSPLPSPEALTEVLYKLADVSVPGDQKLDLVEGATKDAAVTFDKFGKALQDNGYLPIDIIAENIAWSTHPPGNVTADVTLKSQNPAMTTGFTYPMEFKPTPAGGWQLSRTTADILLTLDQNPATPTPTG